MLKCFRGVSMKLFKKKTLEDILKIKNNEQKLNELYKFLSKKCHYGDKLDELNDKEKTLYLVMDFEAEMNEGGFEQFLYSEAGNHIYDTYHSFVEFKRNDIADIIHECILVFPQEEIPAEQIQRQQLLELLLNDGPIFNDLNNRIDLNLMDDYLEYIKNINEA